MSRKHGGSRYWGALWDGQLASRTDGQSGVMSVDEMAQLSDDERGDQWGGMKVELRVK